MKLFVQNSTPSQTGKAARALLLLAGWLWALMAAGPLMATEVRFRPLVTVDRPLVHLGDIADISSSVEADASALATIELFPAPAEGRSRQVFAREIREMLAVRGIDLSGVRFGGYSFIQIKSPHPTPHTAAPAKRSASRRDRVADARIQSAVTDAITQYLRQTVASDTPWEVAVDLDDSTTHHLSRPGCRFSVGGGSPPFVGSQRFVISVATDQGTVNLPVQATVARPELVVVASRAIPTGHIVRTSDVRLQPAPENFRAANGITRLEDVIGKQAARAIAAGHPIDHRAVRSPVLVRRNEPVTLSVQVANVRVRTSARAMADGSLGDLIEVQSLNARDRYLAQVVGVREVAVYPRRVQVAASGDKSTQQGPPASHRARSTEPVVAVGHTRASGTASDWTRLGSKNRR